jgi:hypothetical protein
MASRNKDDIEVEGIPIADEDGKQTKFFNIVKGKFEDLPAGPQKMVFDTETGKLMVVVQSGNRTINLDNRVFTEIDAEGFFVSDFMAELSLSYH